MPATATTYPVTSIPASSADMPRPHSSGTAAGRAANGTMMKTHITTIAAVDWVDSNSGFGPDAAGVGRVGVSVIMVTGVNFLGRRTSQITPSAVGAASGREVLTQPRSPGDRSATATSAARNHDLPARNVPKQPLPSTAVTVRRRRAHAR